jgi:hypothetical protein
MDPVTLLVGIGALATTAVLAVHDHRKERAADAREAEKLRIVRNALLARQQHDLVTYRAKQQMNEIARRHG